MENDLIGRVRESEGFGIESQTVTHFIESQKVTSLRVRVTALRVRDLWH